MFNLIARKLLKGPRWYQDTTPRQEVRRWLMMIQRDPWYKSQMPVTIKGIGKIAGGHRVHIMRRIITELDSIRPMHALVQRIAELMKKLDKREIVFYRGNAGKAAQFCWLTPPQFCPFIKPFCLEEEWSLFARCTTCANNKFMPITTNGENKNYAACYCCIPPSQYKALGVKLTKKSLLLEALAKQGVI